MPLATPRPDMLDALHKRLPPPLLRVLRAMEAASDRGMTPLYVVGGVVRDLVLGLPLRDLDLAVEGDAPTLARAVGVALGARVVAHQAFRTATVEAEGHHVDLVSTRSERYARPGALPEVRPASIVMDLRRRDFSINAMALSVNARGKFSAGTLIDPLDGVGDCHRRVVRVLHDRSFLDDATRILRGVRYEQRLNFAMDEETVGQVRAALAAGALDGISGERVRYDLDLMLREENALKPLLRAADLHVWPAVFPPLDGLPTLREAAPRVQAGSDPLLYVALMAWPLSPREAEGFAKRLDAPAAWRRVIEGAASLHAREGWLAKAAGRPLEVCEALDGLPLQVVEAAMFAAAPEARGVVSRYYFDWRGVKPALRGDDLLLLGVDRGPRLGEVLRDLRRARLEGRVATWEDEERLVREWAQAQSDGGASEEGSV